MVDSPTAAAVCRTSAAPDGTHRRGPCHQHCSPSAVTVRHPQPHDIRHTPATESTILAAPTGAVATVPRVLAFARREPSAVLFFSQLAALLVYPAMEGNDVGRSLFSVLGIAFLGLVVLAVRGSPTWTWLGVLLAIPASVLLLVQVVTRSDALLPYSSAIEAVLYFYAAGGLIA